MKRSTTSVRATRGLMNTLVETEIGLLPETWPVQRLGDVFETQLGKMLSQKAHGGDSPKPYLRNKNVQWGSIDTSDMLEMDFSEREKAKFQLHPGDLLICEGGVPGRAAIWNGAIKECYYQKALHRLRPRNGSVINQFMLHWLRFAFDLQNLYGVSGASSTIAHLPEAQLKALPIPVPPLTEQRRIAEVLGMAQRAIEQQERLIALNTEVKKGLLHKLVTQGLHGEPEKQTEIGPVPQSWEMTTFDATVDIKNGQIDPTVPPFNEMLHVGPENIHSNTGRLTQLRSNAELRITSGNYHFTPDDVLYSKIRPYLNKAALPDFEGTCSADMYPLRSKAGQFLRTYLFQMILSEPFKKQAISLQDRTGIPKINRAQLGSILLPRPPIAEQQDIADCLAMCDNKVEVHIRKHAVVAALFRALLHQLMTAQTRVHNLDLSDLFQDVI